MQLIDFHAHILPGVDDGAANLEETRLLLKSQKDQGVQKVVATPHYNQNCSIDAFVADRDAALHNVRESITEEIPQIIPAAEVLLYHGLSKEPDLRKLCIENTNYILIEMPYFYWNPWDYEELYQLMVRHGVYPIIAHLDRYANTLRDVNNFNKLFEQNVLVQINSDSLLHLNSFRIVKSLWEQDRFTVLGSDAHHNKTRPCTLQQACNKIVKKFGVNTLERIMKNAEDILNNKPILK